MKKEDKKSKSNGKRFDKIVNYIVEKGSPVDKSNPMSVEEEADASLEQEGRKNKLKNVDLSSDHFR